MATIQGPAKKGSVEKKTLHDRMDSLFRINPVKLTARDGSGEKITIEHRIGRDAGYLTRPMLMDKLGFEKDFAEFHKTWVKKVHGKDELDKLLDEHYRALKGKMNRIVQEYRRYLEGLYANYPNRALLPMFAFVPVTDKEDGLYLQGLVELQSYKHVIGEPSDNMLWSEVVYTATKKFRDMNERAENTARALMLLPGLNKDLRQRANLLTQGKLPDRISWNPESK